MPADAAYSRSGPAPPWHLSSNGLASGNCLAEALAHALAELIERDALTVYTLATEYRHLPKLITHIAGPPRTFHPLGRTGRRPLAYPFVSQDTLPSPLRAAVERIASGGARVELRWVASDVAVPVFFCVIHELSGASMSLTHAGSGAHPDAATAARRAVTEAAQSRATYIHGVREDLRHPALRSQDPPSGGWFDVNEPRVDFDTFPSTVFDDIVKDLVCMVQALSAAGLDEIVAVDLSHQEIPFKVVRVIVPGLEAPLDFRNRDRVALGWRARQTLEPIEEAVH